jgi:hypothetical protein
VVMEREAGGTMAGATTEREASFLM